MDRSRHVNPTADETSEPGNFGCPMLSAFHWERTAGLGLPASRCLIGWALRDELSVARCRATPAVYDCWKAHPERTPIVADERRPGQAPVIHAAAAD